MFRIPLPSTLQPSARSPRRLPQRRPALLPLLGLSLALLLPGVAEAKRGGSSHGSSSHSTGHADSSHAAGSKHDSSGPSLSVSLPRPRQGERESSPSTPATTGSNAAEATSPGKQDAGQKAAADAEAARKFEESLTLARQKAAAEQSALAAAEEKKRLDAEKREQDRQQAKLEAAQRQYAWETRCQIKPVMSDEEIATCREVWTRPAPKNWVAGQ